MLIKKAFHQDPRVQQAKKLVLEALQDYQAEVKGIKKEDADIKQEYHHLIAAFNQARANPLWYPYLGSGFGKGSLVELLDGSVKYDFITGIGVHTFGHSHPEIVGACLDAALSDTVMEGNLQQNEDALIVSQLLTRESGLPHCFLTSSGAMANENGLKIVFQKKAPAHRLLAFERCFAGRTVAEVALSDKPQNRIGIPPTLDVDYIPFYDPNNHESSIEEAKKTLKKYLLRYPGHHAAMIFELVQGEAGCYPGCKEFFITLAKLLKEHHIAIIADEVQTFGRLPALFAFKYFGLEEYVDVVTVGKLAQVCATLFSAPFAPKAGLLSQTFTTSVSALHAAQVVIRKLTQENFFGEKGRIQEIHNEFVRHLERLAKHFPGRISGPWGMGSMVAFTLEEGSAEKTLAFSHKLYEAGLLTLVAGQNPMRIRMLPPVMVVTNEEIEAAFRIIESCL